jgi:hypothetical protein
MFPAVKHPFDRLDFEVVRMGMDTLTGAIKNGRGVFTLSMNPLRMSISKLNKGQEQSPRALAPEPRSGGLSERRTWRNSAETSRLLVRYQSAEKTSIPNAKSQHCFISDKMGGEIHYGPKRATLVPTRGKLPGRKRGALWE